VAPSLASAVKILAKVRSLRAAIVQVDGGFRFEASDRAAFDALAGPVEDHKYLIEYLLLFEQAERPACATVH
jgi:hypothetical protein